MPPGVLWVSSRIASPTSPSTTLTPSKFCDWYENQHIYEVTSLPGVPRAARYEAISSQPDATAWSAKAPWLTVYEMPEIEYRETKEFKGLDGQSRPKEELLRGVFEQARFDTRFYEEVGRVNGEGGEGPAKFLLSVASQPAEGAETEFDAWYQEEVIPALQRTLGFRRVKRYKVVNATVLDQFVRKEPEVPQYLAIVEFDGEELPSEELKVILQSQRSRKVKAIVPSEELGWYRLKRVYEDERKS